MSRRELPGRDVTAVTPCRSIRYEVAVDSQLGLASHPKSKSNQGSFWDDIAPLPQSGEQLTRLLDIAPRQRRSINGGSGCVFATLTRFKGGTRKSYAVREVLCVSSTDITDQIAYSRGKMRTCGWYAAFLCCSVWSLSARLA